GPAPWACLPLIACAAASLVGWRAGILTLQLFFLPPILWLALLALLGGQAARLAGFAIGFLYFALPGWGLLGPALQRLTAWAVGVIGPAIGLPLSMSGMRVVLSGGMSFVVTSACSGVDFLTVGLAVAALYGELEHARLRRRAALICGMLLLAIVSNWLRVILIIEIGYRSHMRSELATRGHLAFGWVVFACALLLFVWIAGRTGTRASIAGKFSDDAAARKTPDRQHAGWLRYGMAVTALLIVPVLVYASLFASQPRVSAAALQLPPGRTPWQGPAGMADPLWHPRFVGAHAQLRGRYQTTDGRAVEVVAVGFSQQTQGAQILNERNSLLGHRGLAIQAVSLVADGEIPHGEVVAVDPQGRKSVIWSVIDIGGRLFGEPLSSQLWYGARSLIGVPYSVFFALRAECDSSCDAARVALEDFLRANGPALFGSLPDAGYEG
ncbi:MAG TPA: EpsI family protein, partial [Steroidobacteraceae bacterium]|nr:EpsI family protein [Steroidobacteraceae bacterium]